MRTDESAKDILRAVAHLSVPVSGEGVAHSLGLISIFTGRNRTQAYDPSNEGFRPGGSA